MRCLHGMLLHPPSLGFMERKPTDVEVCSVFSLLLSSNTLSAGRKRRERGIDRLKEATRRSKDMEMLVLFSVRLL